MPGSPRQVPAQDHVGDGSLLLELPGEDGLRVAPKVCVWAQEGVKEQGHGALAPAFEALRQVIQVLEGSGTGQGPPGKGRLCTPTLTAAWPGKLGNAASRGLVKGSDKSCSCPLPVSLRCA